MKQDKMSIQNLQNDSNYIVLDNPFSNPKFIKQLSKTEYKIAKTDTYTLKLFAELLSRLNYEALENTTKANQIEIEINIKDFLEQIGVEHNNGYNYVIEAAHYLKTLIIQWKEDGIYKESVFVSYSEHNPKTGKVNLFVPQQFAKRVLDVGMKENFSFLKQNLFKLDNNQAIKLYQFFKQWQNKGRYETDLVRFKEQFGYNTSGYKDFNRFRERVLEPATKEINKKTDILVSYQTTGDNLDGARPRVKGLIFYITAKDKAKQLPTGERHQTAAPQPEATNNEPKTKPIERTKPPQTTTDTPSEADLLVLAEKLKLNPNQIQTIIGELKGDYVRTFEVLQGCINENKVKTINSPFAYIITSLSTLGVGIYQQERTKAKKKEADRIEKEKQATIERIQKEYQERKKKQFTEIYNKATDQEKQYFVESLKSQKISDLYITKQGEIKPHGIYTIGEALAETKGIGLEQRQAKFRNEVFERYSFQIGYDQNDQVLIIGLFENIEQNQEAESKATEPKATAQEPTQTAEQLAENKKRYQATKRQPKTAAAPKTEKSQQAQKAPPAPADIQEPIKTKKPKSIIQKLSNFFKP